MGIKHDLRKILWKAGVDVCRFGQSSREVARMRRVFAMHDINVVLDVGANTGQFAQYLRSDILYGKKIVSFEPLSSAYEQLRINADSDPRWETFNFALGEADKTTEINIAGNSLSSSLLPMMESHVKAAPQSGYIGQEIIEVRTLDSVFDGLCSMSDKIFLKLDTQGFEKQVLEGAEQSLESIDTVQLEMSLIPVYEAAVTFDELYRFMREKGFELIAMEEVFSDEKTGKLLQIDGVFHRF
ncbi:MAG: FkbM family methyltransferase [Saprospiraceae bacterium]|nr:FkbM family methyltransferase [Pyrinomonadaceae bacterium]